MSFNGSGVFQVNSSGQPVVANTLIQAAVFNAFTADVATGLSTAILKDGTQTITANIPFSGYRLLNIGAASLRTDAAQYAQVQNSASQTVGTIAGTNTITGVLTPALTAYTAGQTFRFVPANDNSGATTINIDSLGAKNIFANGAACVGGEIKQNVPIAIFYDGTQFNILGFASDSGGSSALVGGYIDWTVSGNALTLSVKTNAGNDPSASEPVSYEVRDATAATGEMVPRALTSALTLTVPDTALLGTVSNAAFRLWAVIFNDAGTDRLGVINCATIAANAGSGYNVTAIYPLAGWGIASSTSIGTGSDSAGVFYTDAGVTSKAYATVGYATWESGLAAAGTWSAAPTREQLWGPSVPLPGHRVGYARATKTTAATGNAAALPQDDTIPQNTEGNQLMDVCAIVPSSAANALRVQHVGSYAHDGGASIWCTALFRDSVASALNAQLSYNAAVHVPNAITVGQTVLSGTTASTDFKVRVGNNSNNTFTINGNAGSRIYGGAVGSTTEVEEVMT